MLITSGFPRSGSTYLNQALNLLYYPEQEVNWNRHTVIAIEKANRIMVTFRNPLDAIASWHKYPSMGTLEADIQFYIRFYSSVLKKLKKVVLMDFDYFTKDIEYVKERILTNFSLESTNDVTDDEIKKIMIENNKKINLPQNNKEELDIVKKKLTTIEEFQRCIELFNELKLKTT